MKTLLLSLAAPFRTPRLWALHLPINALLFLCGVAWLRIPDERIWQLILTSLFALALLFTAALLHSGTLRWAAERELTWRQMLCPRWIALAWLLFSVVAFIILYNAYEDYFDFSRFMVWSDYLYSKAPQWLRPHNGSSVFFDRFVTISNFAQHYLLAIVCLPFAAAGIVRASSKYACKLFINWRYWIVAAIGCVFGLWLPGKLIDWAPGEHLRTMEISFVLRIALAYFMATAAWLAVASAIAPLLKPEPTVKH